MEQQVGRELPPQDLAQEGVQALAGAGRRLLRNVYLPDGTLINAQLVKDGCAFAYVILPLTKLDEFRALETDARTHNRGLWAGCNVNTSTDIKQTAGNN